MGIVPGVDSSLFTRPPHCNTTVLQKNVLDGVSESVLGALLLLKEHTYATVVDVDVTITRGYTCVTTRDLIRHEDSVGSLSTNYYMSVRILVGNTVRVQIR